MKHSTSLATRHVALVVVAIALLTLAGCARQSTPPVGVAEVILVEGEASVKDPGKTVAEPAVVGARLKAGDRVHVQSGSVSIRYDAGDTQKVTANTIIEIK